MQIDNPHNHLTKKILVLAIAGLAFGCSGEPEETTSKQNTDGGIVTRPAPEAEVTPGEAMVETAEDALEALLRKADEMIERSESATSEAMDDAGGMLEEAGDAIAEWGQTAEDTLDESTDAAADYMSELDEATRKEVDQLAASTEKALDALATLDAQSPADDAQDTTAALQQQAQEVVKTTPELVRQVQQALADAGFNPGSADGLMGPRTRNALADFQQQNGLTTGKLTRETLQKLGIDDD